MKHNVVAFLPIIMIEVNHSSKSEQIFFTNKKFRKVKGLILFYIKCYSYHIKSGSSLFWQEL